MAKEGAPQVVVDALRDDCNRYREIATLSDHQLAQRIQQEQAAFAAYDDGYQHPPRSLEILKDVAVARLRAK